MKLAFLILTAPYEPWKTLLKEGPQKTWAARENLKSNHLSYSYVGRPLKGLRKAIENNVLLQEKTISLKRREKLLELSAKFTDHQTIQVPFYDTWNTMYEKFILSSQILLETFEFDYLIRVNTTTYVDTEKLMLFLDKDIDYGGIQTKQKKFASGWGIVISRKALRRVVESARKIKADKCIYDDEIIGRAMLELGFTLNPIPSITVETLEDVQKLDREDFAPFIRMKTSVDGNRTDYIAMQLLHNKYLQRD